MCRVHCRDAHHGLRHITHRRGRTPTRQSRPVLHAPASRYWLQAHHPKVDGRSARQKGAEVKPPCIAGQSSRSDVRRAHRRPCRRESFPSTLQCDRARRAHHRQPLGNHNQPCCFRQEQRVNDGAGHRRASRASGAGRARRAACTSSTSGAGCACRSARPSRACRSCRACYSRCTLHGNRARISDRRDGNHTKCRRTRSRSQQRSSRPAC